MTPLALRLADMILALDALARWARRLWRRWLPSRWRRPRGPFLGEGWRLLGEGWRFADGLACVVLPSGAAVKAYRVLISPSGKGWMQTPRLAGRYARTRIAPPN